MENEVLNIFSSNILGENVEKNFRTHDHFLGEGDSAKNKNNLFYQKLDAKYFHVK